MIFFRDKKRLNKITEVSIMSNAQTVYVDFASLESHIKQLETLLDEYRTAYQADLYTNALDEVKSGYQGKDCDSFVTKVEEFRDDFEKMSSVISQYIEHLRKVLKDYKVLQDQLEQDAKAQKGNMQ